MFKKRGPLSKKETKKASNHRDCFSFEPVHPSPPLLPIPCTTTLHSPVETPPPVYYVKLRSHAQPNFRLAHVRAATSSRTESPRSSHLLLQHLTKLSTLSSLFWHLRTKTEQCRRMVPGCNGDLAFRDGITFFSLFLIFSTG